MKWAEAVDECYEIVKEDDAYYLYDCAGLPLARFRLLSEAKRGTEAHFALIDAAEDAFTAMVPLLGGEAAI